MSSGSDRADGAPHGSRLSLDHGLRLGGALKVRAVLENHHTAPISEAEKVLFTFLEKVNADSAALRQEDVDAVPAL
jgi:hypothetical protein